MARPTFKQVLLRAATNSWNLVVAGLSAVGAAAFHQWPIAAVGGVAYLAMVAWDAANPDFWKKVTGDAAAEAVKLPSPAQIKDPQIRQAVEKMLAARTTLANVLAETPEDVRAHLGGVLSLLAELDARGARLAARGEDLAAYLKTIDANPIIDEQQKLGEKLRRAKDPQARAQYEQTLKAREEQLQALRDIADARDRIDASLSRIVAALESLPVKVVRMRALDAQTMDEVTGDVNQELENVNSEMRVFEETLKSLAEVQVA